jgi:hypothetical protein
MNPPTLSTLPEDILEEICSFIEEDSKHFVYGGTFTLFFLF